MKNLNFKYYVLSQEVDGNDHFVKKTKNKDIESYYSSFDFNEAVGFTNKEQALKVKNKLTDFEVYLPYEQITLKKEDWKIVKVTNTIEFEYV